MFILQSSFSVCPFALKRARLSLPVLFSALLLILEANPMHYCCFTAEEMVAGDLLGARDVPEPPTVGRDLALKSDLLFLTSVLKQTNKHTLIY